VAAAEPEAAGAGTGTAALTLGPAHRGGRPAGSGRGPAYFHTLAPGAALPSGAQCARRVRARPPAQQYIQTVEKYLRERIWTQPDFQEP
jgi:hypothetical protein